MVKKKQVKKTKNSKDVELWDDFEEHSKLSDLNDNDDLFDTKDNTELNEDSIFSDDDLREDDQMGGMLNEDLGMEPVSANFGDTAMQRHGDLLKELTNFDPFFSELFKDWLGLHWSEEAKDYVPDPEVSPIANKKMAKWALSVLRVYARKNNIITNLSKDEYTLFIEEVIDTVYLNIGTRAEEFGITNDGDIITIGNQLDHGIRLVLLGAGDGGYNKLLTHVTSRTENVSMNGNDMIGSNHRPTSKGFVQTTKDFLRSKI